MPARAAAFRKSWRLAATRGCVVRPLPIPRRKRRAATLYSRDQVIEWTRRFLRRGFRGLLSEE